MWKTPKIHVTRSEQSNPVKEQKRALCIEIYNLQSLFIHVTKKKLGIKSPTRKLHGKSSPEGTNVNTKITTPSNYCTSVMQRLLVLYTGVPNY